MAGDYIPLDHELPATPQVLALAERAGVDVDVVVGRLALFWIWVDRMTTDGHLAAIGPAAIARQCGGDTDFWRHVEAVGWLELTDAGATMPDYTRRFSNGARRRMKDAQRKARGRRAAASSPPDPPAVDLAGPWPPEFAAAVPIEARARFSAGSTPAFPGRVCDDDRLFLLKLAALRLAGLLSEHELTDGLEALRRHDSEAGKPIANRTAYLWTVLINNMAPPRAAELKLAVATCQLPDGLTKRPAKGTKTETATP